MSFSRLPVRRVVWLNTGNKFAAAALFTALILGACATDPAAPIDTAGRPLVEELSALLEQVEAASEAPEPEQLPEPILVPRTAPWLGLLVEGTYQSPPRDAVENLLSGRSLRWELTRAVPDVLVVPPSGSRTVSEHLDHIAVQADWSWRLDGAVVVVEDFPTRHYPIASLPGGLRAVLPARALDQAQNIGGGSLGGLGAATGAGGQGGDRLENTRTLDLDAIQDFASTLAQILALPAPQPLAQSLLETPENPEGGEALDAAPDLGATGANASYRVSAAANLVTITAPPSIHARAVDFIEAHNAAANRRAVLTITVFELAFTDSNQRSVDFSLLRDAATAANLTLTSPEFDISDPNGITLRVDSMEGNSFDTSNLLLRLMETQGSTSVRLHERLEVTHNAPVAISDERVLPYVSEISTNNQVGGAFSTLGPQIETSQLNTGVALNVLASIAGERINIRLGFSLSQLVRFDAFEFGTGESAVSGALPVTDAQHRIFPFSIGDGETRLIANVTKTSVSDESANRAFGLLGGSRLSDNTETQTVIAVTARVL